MTDAPTRQPTDPTEVSILLPLKHFVEAYLHEAVASVFGQTSDAWQLLVIVGPADEANFRSLLAEAFRDPRVRMVVNDRPGLAAALNEGMRAADTGFVGILLGDDLWEPTAVATLRENTSSHPEVDFFHSARRIVDGAGHPISSVYDARDSFTSEDFVFKSPVKHLLCWRREKALSFGGLDETLNNVGVDDHDFPWLMADHGAVFRAIHECLYIYRDHRDGYRLTTHLPRSVHLREQRRILEKHGVSEPLIKRRLREARNDYLRECLYHNELHARIWEWLGWQRNPQSGWRQPYR